MSETRETVTQIGENIQQIVRSRTCGCKDLHIAKVTKNDANTYTAEKPIKLARAVKVKVDEKKTSEKIYSDDGTEEDVSSLLPARLMQKKQWTESPPHCH